MSSSIVRRRSSRLAVAAIATATASLIVSPLMAADGTWTNPAGGAYGDVANWLGGSVADGSGAVANFTTDITSALATPTTVTLAEPRTLGAIVFGDADLATAGSWLLTGSTITLAGPTTPTITAGPLAAGSRSRIDSLLAGTQGVVINGGGTLSLFGAANTYTGGTTISGGTTVALSNLSTLGANTAANGLTLDNGTVAFEHSASTTSVLTSPVAVASGSTGTLRLSRRTELRGAVSGDAASTLNIVVASQENRNDFRNSFANFFGTLNLTSNTPGTARSLRLLANNTAPTFTANSLANATVNADDVFVTTRGFSGGTTIVLGALGSTGAGATLGGTDGTGGAITYQIGAKNVDAIYGGQLTAASLVKVGTGKQTFTNALTYAGNTTVSGGTLGFAGNGSANASPLLTFANNTTLDVSGTTNTFSTAAGQTIVTGATTNVVGNFAHDEGTLTVGGLSAAGTLNFANNLSVLGTATLNFEVSPNTAPGGTNDLLNVTGATDLSGAVTLNLGLVGGVSAGTYTIVQSAGGISGDVSGWTVNSGLRGAPPALTLTPNALQLTVNPASAATLVFTGAGGSNFDVNATTNFTNAGTPDKFFQLDTVRFDDTAATGAVTVVGGVAPTALTVDNNTLAYAFTGTGSIVGSGNLTKRGTGTLTLGTANGYTGGTRVEGGVLDVGTFDNAIGTGTLALAGGTFRTTKTNANYTFANALVATGTNTIEANGAGRQFILAGPVSGNGALTITTIEGGKGVDFSGDTSGLTGTLNLVGGVSARLISTSAANGNNAGLALDIGAGASLGTLSATPKLVRLGALSGNGTLRGHQSSGNGSTAEYEIGALNTNTTFDGPVVDGLQGPDVKALALTKVGTGTLTLNGANAYTGTTTVRGGTLSLGTAAVGTVLNNAAVTTTGGADIQGGKLVVSYAGGTSPAGAVAAALDAGYDQSPRFSSGVLRSTTLADKHVLGWLDNAAASAVTVAYTLAGDSNLDFTVAFADLVTLAQNYETGTGKIYAQGDTNYDGVVTFADLVSLAQNYGGNALTGPQVAVVGTDFAADFALAQAVAVPEPTVLGLLGAASLVALRRRR